jgi:hypothetical protein
MGLRIAGTGWWEYERKVEEGQFLCPREQSQQTYRVMRSNRWITVLYVPVIPMGTLGMWVKCRSCKGIFHLDVINTPTEAGAEVPTVKPAGS